MSLCCNGIAELEQADAVGCYIFDYTGEELELIAGTGVPAENNGLAKITYGKNPDDLLCFSIRSGSSATACGDTARAMPSVQAIEKSFPVCPSWLAHPIGIPGKPPCGGLLAGFTRTVSRLSAASCLYLQYVAAHFALLTANQQSNFAIMALERDLLRLQQDKAPPVALISEIVGNSEASRHVCSLIKKAAKGNATVLITGETGTGKELVASSIHQRSERKDKPFIALNCSAIPEHLLESEFFGHERGAFTGAVKASPGLIRSASGGTLLLDEVGDMPLPLQAKILRFLQEKTVRPVGGATEHPVDVRIIAATNSNLGKAVEEGGFRRDLYHRLAIFTIEIPPLRQRVEDIVPLTEHFVRYFATKYRCKRPKICSEDVQNLYKMDFFGNVRELSALIERAFASWDGEAAFKLDLRQQEKKDVILPEAVQGFEKILIRQALERSGGNTQIASEALGIPRRTLAYKLKQYGFSFAPSER